MNQYLTSEQINDIISNTTNNITKEITHILTNDLNVKISAERNLFKI